MVVEIKSKQDFQNEVTNFAGVVVMDCWAEWCGPCRMLAPILEDVAASFKDDMGVKVVKLNVEFSRDNAEIAQDLGVMNIPAIFYFKNGALASQSVGAAPKDFFVGKINELKSA